MRSVSESGDYGAKGGTLPAHREFTDFAASTSLNARTVTLILQCSPRNQPGISRAPCNTRQTST